MPKQKLTSDDLDSYCKLRESLDALRDSVLVQYTLCHSGNARTKFTDDVEAGVKNFLNDIVQTPAFKQEWISQNRAFLADVSNAKAGCPPGFVEVDGMCVRIP